MLIRRVIQSLIVLGLIILLVNVTITRTRRYEHYLSREKVYSTYSYTDHTHTTYYSLNGNTSVYGDGSGLGSSAIYNNHYFALMDGLNKTDVKLFSADLLSGNDRLDYSIIHTQLPTIHSSIGLATNGSSFWTISQNIAIPGWSIYEFNGNGVILHQTNITVTTFAPIVGSTRVGFMKLLGMKDDIAELFLTSGIPRIYKNSIFAYNISSGTVLARYLMPPDTTAMNIDERGILWLSSAGIPLESNSSTLFDTESQGIWRTYHGYTPGHLGNLSKKHPDMAILEKFGANYLQPIKIGNHPYELQAMDKMIYKHAVVRLVLTAETRSRIIEGVLENHSFKPPEAHDIIPAVICAVLLMILVIYTLREILRWKFRKIFHVYK